MSGCFLTGRSSSGRDSKIASSQVKPFDSFTTALLSKNFKNSFRARFSEAKHPPRIRSDDDFSMFQRVENVSDAIGRSISPSASSPNAQTQHRFALTRDGSVGWCDFPSIMGRTTGGSVGIKQSFPITPVKLDKCVPKTRLNTFPPSLRLEASGEQGYTHAVASSTATTIFGVNRSCLPLNSLNASGECTN